MRESYNGQVSIQWEFQFRCAGTLLIDQRSTLSVVFQPSFTVVSNSCELHSCSFVLLPSLSTTSFASLYHEGYGFTTRVTRGRFFNMHAVPRCRSSRPEVFLGVLKICCKGTGEHSCRSVISIKLFCNFFEIAPRHGFSPVNLLHIIKTPFQRTPLDGCFCRCMIFQF